MSNSLEKILERTKWFREDRFGMFIHWGLYAIPGRGEWVQTYDRMSTEEYYQYFEAFNPTDYDPKAWAKAAKEAGMKYVVLTAKHHDGFCLFDSQYTDFKATKTAIGRDLIAEYVDALREVGLKVGLYFSLIDWHHPDYPKYNDWHHPLRGQEAYKDEVIDFDNYLTYMHNQVEELVTNYGKLDILWFDFSYDQMTGEKWRAEELMAMVRKHQPDVVIDNRLETSGEAFGSIVSENPSNYSGDFFSPEQLLPPEGIVNNAGIPIPWELCITMNNNWGYNPIDKDYKTSKTLIRKLVECVSKNGNMLLNVGPDAKGKINHESLTILQGFNDWMTNNSESIYGCGMAQELSKPEWGYYTQKENILYAHVFDQPIGPLAVPGLAKERIKRASLLYDGSEIKVSDSWTTKAFDSVTFLEFGGVSHFTYALPDEVDTVIKIELYE
ncbi:alpha-L-fucosidase [Enterococcus sp. LJL98]